MPKDSVYAIPMTSIDSSTFVGTYKVIDAAGFPNECFLVRIINNSDVDVLKLLFLYTYNHSHLDFT